MVPSRKFFLLQQKPVKYPRNGLYTPQHLCFCVRRELSTKHSSPVPPIKWEIYREAVLNRISSSVKLLWALIGYNHSFISSVGSDWALTYVTSPYIGSEHKKATWALVWRLVWDIIVFLNTFIATLLACYLKLQVTGSIIHSCYKSCLFVNTGSGRF